MHATVSLSAQDEDIIDKFGEYGAVKAGNPSVIANRISVFLTCGARSQYADGSQNWLYQRICFCRVRVQAGGVTTALFVHNSN
jgi:hypothetical protein